MGLSCLACVPFFYEWLSLTFQVSHDPCVEDAGISPGGMALGEWRTGRRRKERGSSISVGSVWGGALNPLLTRIFLGGFDFWPSKTRTKATTTTATGGLKQRWRLGKVGCPPCFSCATLARNLKRRWRLGAVSHPPLSHVTAKAAAAAAVPARGGSKRRGKATTSPRLCPPPLPPARQRWRLRCTGG